MPKIARFRRNTAEWIRDGCFTSADVNAEPLAKAIALNDGGCALGT